MTSLRLRHRRRLLISVSIAAAVALLATGCTSSKSDNNAAAQTTGTTDSASTSAASATPTPAPTATPTPAGKPVHISSVESDGSVWGVGMPIILKFNVAPKTSTDFLKATTVTVNGQPANGAWYFEDSSSFPGTVMEAHYRPKTYWPANARIVMTANTKDVSAGAGLYFDDNFSLSMATSDARIGVVDAVSLQMTVTLNGARWGTFPVSLGSEKTPTQNGTKVIMEKGAVVRMTGPGYDECCVKWTQRLTYGGEYLHAAPWNTKNLGKRSTSNGCTNLSTDNAKKLYSFLQQGDPIQYPNANGPAMKIGDGYGDWNVPWPVYSAGGALLTHT
ncbi:lipoprotein-anchoring transpeptidase ErfK/SrfK [Jatrophihabitans sp. GAS493]|uniref:L,D-transpeptidase n=1 Tax=Jatrophihabitans sp. GAS493 TaxID=1907575 RepID=UPI000BB96973|nr:L,D-transpeptidase [Jatrophihabitans sp. GAS493]SOD73438.1 lipoprotein-anchoring transpeptidase ErfK/SrfK [Jatrophihabitans sp. GAS493]